MKKFFQITVATLGIAALSSAFAECVPGGIVCYESAEAGMSICGPITWCADVCHPL